MRATTQQHANERQRAQTQVRKRVQKCAKECKRAFSAKKKLQTTRFETTRFGNSQTKVMLTEEMDMSLMMFRRLVGWDLADMLYLKLRDTKGTMTPALEAANKEVEDYLTGGNATMTTEVTVLGGRSDSFRYIFVVGGRGQGEEGLRGRWQGVGFYLLKTEERVGIRGDGRAQAPGGCLQGGGGGGGEQNIYFQGRNSHQA